MTSYRVIIQPSAKHQIRAAYVWGEQRWPKATNAEWFTELAKAIDSLKTFPERFALAPEGNWFTHEIRQMVYHPYRIFYRIVGQEVRVIAVKRSSQHYLRS